MVKLNLNLQMKNNNDCDVYGKIVIGLIMAYFIFIILPVILIVWCIVGIPYYIYNYKLKPDHTKFEGF